MKNRIGIAWSKMALMLILILTISACTDSFEKEGFDVDSPSNTTSFSINGTAGDINQKTGIINVTMPYGSDISTVIPAVILQEGATSNLAINTPIDFTKSVKFRVINGDRKSTRLNSSHWE